MADFDSDRLPAEQQLLIWKDKCQRLSDQYTALHNLNKNLEERLITVVDKIERDKALLSDEIDHLAEKLACSTNTIDYYKVECARYKSDCMLAVHLLQCQPSFYTTQHLNSLPPELRKKMGSDTASANDPNFMSPTIPEKKVINFSASVVTFPPTAIFLHSNEPEEPPPEEPDGRRGDGARELFVNKILTAPEYHTEKLAQCPKCGFALVKYDRCTQTPSLSNSRSAPQLIPALGFQQPAERRHEFLIDLLDEEPSPATSPCETKKSGSASANEVRFNVSPAVHQHHSQSQQHFPDEFAQEQEQEQRGYNRTGYEYRTLSVSDNH